MLNPKRTLLILFTFAFSGLMAQTSDYTRQDTLRGSITPERSWWDLTYYHLDIKVNPDDKTIFGKNTIQYKVLEAGQRMQIDLQPPMEISKVEQKGNALDFERDGNVYFVTLKETQKPGTVNEVTVHYGGVPTVAVRAPWDGGLSWDTDENGNPFVATSCQGEGASMWWPCKDHMYDEPDSMLISVTVPKGLMGVANGRLRKTKKQKGGWTTYSWYVDNPINNYGVNVNIGDYAHFSEVYPGEKGDLDMDYYVLSYNLEKAKEQFKDAAKMMKAFEHWFGPYPFYEDSYKLVEVPYLGMEHQSSVTYGNKYKNGYLGRDLSATGWGDKFDYIIIHESGHEWFANNITYKDMADMWIHESFTTYSENLFVDYYWGKEASSEYVRGLRINISNDEPIIGDYEVNHSGSGDMYPKGANMIHMIRQMVDDDEKWRKILRGMNEEFYHQTVTTAQIEDYLIEQTGIDLAPVFDQYLRTADVPIFEFRQINTFLIYRWANVIPDFRMKVKIWINGEEKWLDATTQYGQLKDIPEDAQITVDPNFYVVPFNQMGE